MSTVAWGASIAALTIACGANLPPAPPTSHGGTPTDAEASPPEWHLASAVEPAQGVVAVAGTCVEDAAEVCNGIDDNCDGRIDNACGGPERGDLQVFGAWAAGSDLELVVEAPCGELATEPPNACEGRFRRVEARGCPTNGSSIRVSQLDVTAPIEGAYRVFVAQREPCGREPGPVSASVSLQIRGQVIGPLNVTVPATGRTAVASFAIDFER